MKTTINICTRCHTPRDTALPHVCDDRSSSPMRKVEPPPPQIGMVIDRKYQLHSKLGEGGMGSVFRARRRYMDDFVAIKFIRPEVVADPYVRKRFCQEAQVAALIKHPNVVSVYDFGETPEGLVYLVMEYLEGISLGQLLRKNGSLTLDLMIELGGQICEALTCMHLNNVIHRDLKPDNIMLIKDGTGDMQVKMVDFGVAKFLESNSRLTRVRSRLGSPVYSSPEQCLGRQVDHRTDLYALGVIFYECLTGNLPFKAHTEGELFSAILHQEPPRVDKLVRGSAARLADLVHQLLSKHPSERPQDAAQVKQSLQHLRREHDRQFVVHRNGNAKRAIKSPSAPPANVPLLQRANSADLQKPRRRRREKRLPVAALRINKSLRRGDLLPSLVRRWLFAPSGRRHYPLGLISIVAITALVMAFSFWQRAALRAWHPMVGRSFDNMELLLSSVSKSFAALYGEFAWRFASYAATREADIEDSTSIPGVVLSSTETAPVIVPASPSLPVTLAAQTAQAESSLTSQGHSTSLDDKQSPGASRESSKGEARSQRTEIPVAARDIVVALPARIDPTPVVLQDRQIETVVSPTPPGMILVKPSSLGNGSALPDKWQRISEFFIGKHEITNREYFEFVRATGTHQPEWQAPGSKYHYQTGTDDFYRQLGPALEAPEHPVVGVSFFDAQRYCEWLTERTGIKYRLPSEAEWEIAAGGGQIDQEFSWGNAPPTTLRGGNVGDLSLKKIFPTLPVTWRDYDDRFVFSAPVGYFGANALGCYDMTGNVAEWCSDTYVPEAGESVTSSSQTMKAIRGGSWGDTPDKLRISYRMGASLMFRSNNLGFRLAATVQ